MNTLYRQLAQVVPTTFGALILVFVVMRVLPGDAAVAMLGTTATPDAIVALRANLGLDRPLWEQLLSYLWGLARLDLGQSLALRAPVRSLLADALPHTILLTLGGTLVGTAIGVPLGVLAALKRGTWIDYLASTGAILGISVPVFVWGVLLLLAFSLEWPLFPSSGGGNTPLEALRALVLPSIATGLLLTGLVSRISRASVLQVLSQDYVRTARAKGVPEWGVLSTHVLKNALIPILTVIGLNVGTLLSGAVVAETVFSRPGIGRVALEAILARDYPVIQGVVIVSVIAVVLINLLVDLLYGVVDPRVRT
ncbi:MAG TPA: ABC transporter permease [Chloroflexota bacterium]|nr:ABC transporter permease [Chloroflexota bacterium]